MTDHLCNYSEPVEGEPFARACSVCGERQVYRAPKGSQSAKVPVLVDRDDLRHLLTYADDLFSEYGSTASDEIVERVRALLD